MDKKWNLQDIKPSQPRKRRTQPPPDMVRSREHEVTAEDDGTVRIGVRDGRAKNRSRYVIAFALFFAIFGVGFITSILLGGADLTIYPRNREPNVNASFTAYRTPTAGELTYEIMTLEAEGERQVTATGQDEVSDQAIGRITIYNNSDSAERLIKNTRFESPDGLIYRITESAVVPAAGISGGQQVPGQIQADVFSDGTGEQYNKVAGTRFTVPGYKEGGFTDLFKNIYAENQEQFTGGFEGLKFIIDEQELETEKQRLQTELRDILIDRIPSEKPAGFVVFDDAVTLTFQSLPAVEYGDNLATIKEKAILQIPIFKDQDFANYIAAATVPGYENRPVRIDDLSVLSFDYVSADTGSSDLGSQDSFVFELTGRPLIVWTYDEGKLKTDIMGKAKTALPTVLSGYPAIERAEAVVRPFWKRVFPDSLDEITITEIIEKK